MDHRDDPSDDGGGPGGYDPLESIREQEASASTDEVDRPASGDSESDGADATATEATPDDSVS